MTYRWVELARGVWGVALLVASRRALDTVGATTDGTSIAVVRVLGARQLTQAVLSGLHPSPEVLATGVWVDAVHAATSAALAAVNPRRGVAGSVDAVIAAGWALAGLRDLWRAPTYGPSLTPGHDRVRDRLARLVLRHVPGGAPLLTLVDRARRRDRPSPRSATEPAHEDPHPVGHRHRDRPAEHQPDDRGAT